MGVIYWPLKAKYDEILNRVELSQEQFDMEEELFPDWKVRGKSLHCEYLRVKIYLFWNLKFYNFVVAMTQ